MSDGFFLGAFFSVALLAIGALLGVGLSYYLWPGVRREHTELHPMLDGLRQFTSRFSRDVSEYRSLIETAAQRAKELSLEANPSGDNKNSVALITRIMEANEHLRRRLEEAEASLQSQSEELSCYMTEARTDALTGLPNRRAFDDELNRRMALYRRQGTTFGVLLLDVDRFKNVNDKYGHHVGDEVLKGVARSLQSAVRDCDLIGRYGGEEFGVLIAGSTADEFIGAAERFRRVVESSPIDVEQLHLKATISCGIAAVLPGEETSSLICRADEALYASKSGGRNRTHWHDGRYVVPTVPPATPSIDAIPLDTTKSSENFRDVCAELRRKLMELSK